MLGGDRSRRRGDGEQDHGEDEAGYESASVAHDFLLIEFFGLFRLEESYGNPIPRFGARLLRSLDPGKRKEY
jgi:hypothetical protein